MSRACLVWYWVTTVLPNAHAVTKHVDKKMYAHVVRDLEMPMELFTLSVRRYHWVHAAGVNDIGSGVVSEVHTAHDVTTNASKAAGGVRA